MNKPNKQQKQKKTLQFLTASLILAVFAIAMTGSAFATNTSFMSHDIYTSTSSVSLAGLKETYCLLGDEQ